MIPCKRCYPTLDVKEDNKPHSLHAHHYCFCRWRLEIKELNNWKKSSPKHNSSTRNATTRYCLSDHHTTRIYMSVQITFFCIEGNFGAYSGRSHSATTSIKATRQMKISGLNKKLRPTETTLLWQSVSFQHANTIVHFAMKCCWGSRIVLKRCNPASLWRKVHSSMCFVKSKKSSWIL